MSRIEKALEKALKQREAEGGKNKAEDKAPQTAPPAEKFMRQGAIGVDNPYLMTITDPGSPISEEYRKLKSLVVKLLEMEKFHNTIMVSSALGGEGKSLTALNLALTLAEGYDHTVLVVDADLRNPSLHKYLGIAPTVGLADCLMDGVDVSEAVINTGLGTLSLLPSGKKVPNPVELISSSRMRKLVAELKQQYTNRYIIFDTPPVLPFAEAHNIARIVDAVLFVVRHGHVSLDDVKESLNMLKDARLYGIIYNAVPQDRSNDRYYSYYYGAHRARQD
jgi:exopolysaccharide/PEP-CTERM locus tyrosine autokinase